MVLGDVQGVEAQPVVASASEAVLDLLSASGRPLESMVEDAEFHHRPSGMVLQGEKKLPPDSGPAEGISAFSSEAGAARGDRSQCIPSDYDSQRGGQRGVGWRHARLAVGAQHAESRVPRHRSGRRRG